MKKDKKERIQIKQKDRKMQIPFVFEDNTEEEIEVYVIALINEFDSEFIYLYWEKEKEVIIAHFDSETEFIKPLANIQEFETAARLFLIMTSETEFFFGNKKIEYTFSNFELNNEEFEKALKNLNQLSAAYTKENKEEIED
ncbi:hypothetical protein [Mesomycoplasma neurolyticum]|uniref:Uncharacterized protein n=1 Tax=Mesomycoplasma neurolyticum TaxID=2120 RepID=A0A449A6E4_9BACT|nr:hypothetical protein [Mesomycoplasma neurolyticum]VEU59787.1 Uncharacterised protein [Mesomycoplasma neurolyticum]